MNKKISYITLISDLYLLLVFSYIIYGIFFGFERIGNASFNISNINSDTALIITLIEMLFCIIVAYLLHKCNYKKIRIVLIVLCILNIIYRILNMLFIITPLTLLMLFISIILFIILLFY